MRRIESVKLYIVTCVSICNGRLKEHVIQWAVAESRCLHLLGILKFVCRWLPQTSWQRTT